MQRMVGTVSRGVRAPIIRQGDDIAKIVADCVLAASAAENSPMRDRDVVAVTEAVVGRAQGNYATVDQIAADIRAKFPDGHAAIIFPILSRNRFSVCLKGIAAGLKKLTVMLSYPSDEVGNHLISPFSSSNSFSSSLPSAIRITRAPYTAVGFLRSFVSS